MSQLAATQIPKPADEQAFERASVVLWCGLLNDPSVQRNGRRGQRQNGVDLYGVRDGNLDAYVGIQCKLKGDGQTLAESEVRDEVRKALTFEPPLKEYYIVTTAPVDVAMQELAREITGELAAAGKTMRVFVWGWNTLEERISEDVSARKAFDPTHALFGDELLAEAKLISAGQDETRAELDARFSRIEAMITESSGRLANPPGDSTVEINAVEAHLDAQIDEYRELNNEGKTLIALPLLEKLLTRVAEGASGRILFRIKANIGHCLLALARDDDAISMLSASYEHAPGEPKAIANKAFALLLEGKWEELLAFGKMKLEADPENEWLAGYLVQAARFDMSVTDPLELVPEELHRSEAVQIGRVDFVRHRGKPGEWWGPAREALAIYSSEPHIVQFAAEADLDEILTTESLQRVRVMPATARQKLEAATATLAAQWDRKRQTDGPLRPEDAALCGNVVVGLAALCEFCEALNVARQGLALAPEDTELLVRTAMVAIEAADEPFAEELLAKLPVTADSVVLKFRYHAGRAEWDAVLKIFEDSSSLIPETEKAVFSVTAKLAAIKIGVGDTDERRQQISAIALEAQSDPRACIIVADFARRDGMDDLAKDAFESALKQIDGESHTADRLMVAYHANRRGDASIVADLLDGRIAEDYDSAELRMLANAFVNDSPIRQRALSFFGRLPAAIRALPYYLHAEGMLHFNRGALSESEDALRKAAAAEPDLDNYISLFIVLHRADRSDEIKAVVDEIDLKSLRGTPTQKMFLAQVMRKVGEGSKALKFAYDVLQSARNDQQAVLRYFGLIMLNPDEGLIPSAETVAVDTWVRLEGDRHERNAFLIEEGPDCPADDVMSPAHPMAAAALGLRVGEEFEMSTPLGGTRRWRVVEIKHKYLHALHDVMENFENRFPDAQGFYTITMEDGDIQPALDQVRRVAESNRNRADLYLKQECPIRFVVAKGDRDTIRFAEYVRFLDFDIRTCLGTEPERLAARSDLEARRRSGAVLDAYAAWTVSTMDAFDVLHLVFEKLFVPQTVIDEIRNLRDEQEPLSGPSMTMTWHNGEYIRQEHTAEDIATRRDYIVEQLTRIESTCEILPVVAPDAPSDVAAVINQSFDSHVLDAANLAGGERLLLSEDMYYRRFAEAACAAKGAWLQVVFSFAHENGLIGLRRYADLVAKLAWRRHGHLALNADTLLAVLGEDGGKALNNFNAVANFIGTQNAEIRSHIEVSNAFLNRLWQEYGDFDLRCMRATSAILERLVRFRAADWAIVLAYLRHGVSPAIQRYIDGWVKGHCLSGIEFSDTLKEMASGPNR